jgi:hypothetical protein
MGRGGSFFGRMGGFSWIPSALTLALSLSLPYNSEIEEQRFDPTDAGPLRAGV